MHTYEHTHTCVYTRTYSRTHIFLRITATDSTDVSQYAYLDFRPRAGVQSDLRLEGDRGDPESDVSGGQSKALNGLGFRVRG